MWQPHHLAVGGIRSEDAGAYCSYVFRQGHYQFFADGVDGGVCHLGKLLAEVVEQRLWTIANDGQRCVIAHSSNWFLASCSHRYDGLVDVFLTISEADKFALEVLNRILHMASALEFL